MTKANIYSWGNYPAHPQTPHYPHWRDDVAQVLKSVTDEYGSTLPFGNGRSYGDSCLAASGQVLHSGFLNRFIRVDWGLGIVTAEAGVSLAEILAVAIPNGWFLSVSPGTQFVTLGGAIANDVHGKNHHVRGTFGCHVRRLGLMRGDAPPMECSALENPDLFSATIGGLGLTGMIAWAEIQMMPIKSSQIDTRVQRFNNLEEFFSLSSEYDTRHEYSVAWIDCLAKAEQSGRGVFIVGDHASYGSLKVESGDKVRMPVKPPFSMINNLSLRAFNNLYWRVHPGKVTYKRSGYQPFFYPLDRVLYWNRIYGRKGFQQYQCVIPEDSARDCMAQILRIIAKAGQGSFLAVLKRCGNLVSPGLLSFPMPGVSLALDFPQGRKLSILFERLDRVVDEARGRLYPAKDAHMSGEMFRRAYPSWERLESYRDPSLSSEFWNRVTK